MCEPPTEDNIELDQQELDREKLIQRLQLGAQLEHSLMLSYLYAACTLKSCPHEFAATPRKALQYERCREWKKRILKVAQEEMKHTHYVMCFLRTLGAPAYFDIPGTHPEGGWNVPTWKPKNFDQINNPDGVHVRIKKLDLPLIEQFVQYESAVSLQEQMKAYEGIYDAKKVETLFARMATFERDIVVELMVHYMEDKPDKERVRTALKKLFEFEEDINFYGIDIPVESESFPSIAEFYKEKIVPEFEKAFKQKWPLINDRDFYNELGPSALAQEGFMNLIAIGPFSANYSDRTNNFESIGKLVSDIIDEGEGFDDFVGKALKFLDAHGTKVKEYAESIIHWFNKGGKAPENLVESEKLRASHLYRFIIITQQLKMELKLDSNFDPARQPTVVSTLLQQQFDLTPEDKEALYAIKRAELEVPLQLNSAYLVVKAWLTRIYEYKHFEAEKSRRGAIETLVTFPLMTMAIRPLLELTSFFKCDSKIIFQINKDGLSDSKHVQKLFQLYVAGERTQEAFKLIDEQCLIVLTQIAEWTKDLMHKLETTQKNAKSATVKIPPDTLEMIKARLINASELGEFERQFNFRKRGGYSDTPATDGVAETAGREYDEYPGLPNDPLFEDAVLLRLRFYGHATVQLATDPDPPMDEVGVSGTIMLNAADKKKSGVGLTRLDRSLHFQEDGEAIIRQPKEHMGGIGLHVTDASLVSTHKSDTGFIPLGNMTQYGAVQTSGLQMAPSYKDIWKFSDLNKHHFTIELLQKDGLFPRHLGSNHLIWKDGEPIDPFIIKFSEKNNYYLQREIFNEGKKLVDMTPLQRASSSRGNKGFQMGSKGVPDWVRSLYDPHTQNPLMNEDERKLIDSDSPKEYFRTRSQTLSKELIKNLDGNKSEFINDEKHITDAYSYARRMQDVTYYPRSTVYSWSRAYCNYGHSISGEIKTSADDFKINEISSKANFSLNSGIFTKSSNENSSVQIGQPGDSHVGPTVRKLANLPEAVMNTDRMKSNNRWLIKYCSGKMDTDSMTMMMYGDLYIPIQLKGQDDAVNISRKFVFAAGLESIIHKKCIDWNTVWWATGPVESKVLLIPDFMKDKLKELKGIKTGGDENSLKVEISWLDSKINGVTSIASDDTKSTITMGFTLPSKHFDLFAQWSGYLFDQLASKVLPASEIEVNNQI